VRRAIVLSCLSLVLAAAAPAPAAERPGTVTHTWLVRWPAAGSERVYLRKFRARPGLIRGVQVLIGGTAVSGPPYLSTVGCRGRASLAGAQKSWVWDGRDVYVTLLLVPNRCGLAGTTARVVLRLTTVGT
jgi:hypothetical protein